MNTHTNTRIQTHEQTDTDSMTNTQLMLNTQTDSTKSQNQSNSFKSNKPSDNQLINIGYGNELIIDCHINEIDSYKPALTEPLDKQTAMNKPKIVSVVATTQGVKISRQTHQIVSPTSSPRTNVHKRTTEQTDTINQMYKQTDSQTNEQTNTNNTLNINEIETIEDIKLMKPVATFVPTL